MTILLDTTVLSYAVGTEHPLREPCRQLLRAHAAGVVEASTTIEVIQEFVHVRSRRRPRSDAVALGQHYSDALELMSTDRGDLALGLKLFETHEALGAFDSVLAAVTINHQVRALVSADKAFARIPGLTWIDPVSPALQEILLP